MPPGAGELAHGGKAMHAELGQALAGEVVVHGVGPAHAAAVIVASAFPVQEHDVFVLAANAVAAAGAVKRIDVGRGHRLVAEHAEAEVPAVVERLLLDVGQDLQHPACAVHAGGWCWRPRRGCRR